MKYKFPRYIPTNSTPHTQEGINAIVYSYNTGTNGEKPCAIAYYGTSDKAKWHYSFRNDDERTKRIESYFSTIKSNLEYRANNRAEAKAKRVAFKHSYKVGDILYSSWGYDQTNVDFYQVIATTEKTITFQQIGGSYEGTGYMCGNTSAIKDAFLKDSQPHTRTVSPGYTGHEKGIVSFAEHKGGLRVSLWEWNGKPHYTSSYA